MFHPDYKYITDKLPASLVKRAYQRLLCHSRTPIPPEHISKKYDQIEDYLHHTLKVYQNSLDRKRKTMNCKNILQPEVLYSSSIHQPALLQKDDLALSERLKEVKELKQHLLEYNRDTFGRFMQNLTKTHESQIETNRQMRLEIDNLKLQVQGVEKFLAYLRRNLDNSIH